MEDHDYFQWWEIMKHLTITMVLIYYGLLALSSSPCVVLSWRTMGMCGALKGWVKDNLLDFVLSSHVFLVI